jgi:hypothetical protein
MAAPKSIENHANSIRENLFAVLAAIDVGVIESDVEVWDKVDARDLKVAINRAEEIVSLATRIHCRLVNKLADKIED